MTGGVVSAQMTITKVEFNPTLDDAMFRIPR
jgi:outer membrane lipoprotein-sorting protein